MNDQLTPTLSAMLNDFVDMLKYPGMDRGNVTEKMTEMLFVKYGRQLLSRSLKTSVPYGIPAPDYRKTIMRKMREQLQEKDLHWLRVDSRADLFHDGKRIVMVVQYAAYPTYVSAVVKGEKVDVDMFLDILGAEYSSEMEPHLERLYINPNERLDSEATILKPESLVLDPVLAYPYLTQSPAETWKSFEESNSNVILLIGPPGLGKSSFIRAMMQARGWDENINLVDSHDVLTHPGLVDYIRRRPRNSVVITEDSDILVSKREDGNSGMSGLLNAVSGLASTDTKLIISTNLTSLLHVDPALLRPGRMHKVLTFKPLSVLEAMELRKGLGLEEVDFGNEKEVTLAEALNWHDVNGSVIRNTKIGFA